MMNLRRRCENYQFNTIYICGEDNSAADVFSRRENNTREKNKYFLEEEDEGDNFWAENKKARVATLCNYFNKDSFININEVWQQEEDDLAENIKDYSAASYAMSEHEGLLDTRSWTETKKFHPDMIRIMENNLIEDVMWDEIKDHTDRDQQLQYLIH